MVFAHDGVPRLFRELDRLDAEVSGVKPTKRVITTMTFSITLHGCDHLTRLDPQHMAEHHLHTAHGRVVIEPSKFSAYAVKVVARDAFPTVNVKVFPKGILHITGCKSTYQLEDVVAMICDILRTAYPGTVPLIRTATLNMINLGITCPFNVRLTSFSDACRREGAYAEQPEKPPSCIVRHYGTVLIYKSGKMVVTAKTIEDCYKAYGFVIKTLNKYPNSFQLHPEPPQTNALTNEKIPANAAKFLRSDTSCNA